MMTDHAINDGAARPAFADKLKDIASASPLIGLYAFVIAGLILGFRAKFAPLAEGVTPLLALELVQQIATLAFIALQTTLFIVRRLPLRKAQGWMPRLAGIVGSNTGFLFLLLPRVAQSPTMLFVSTAAITIGLAASVYCAAHLGRAFSILPQARGFVSRGPYAIVRHPLYLSEQITTFGLCGQYLQPWSLLIAFATLGLQLVRMHYEEEVLAQTFPAYRDYAARTARLIPGIY